MNSIEYLKARKKSLKMTNRDIASNAGLPLSTVEQIMCGKVKSPRLDTLQAIEKALGLETQEEQWSDMKKVGITADEEEMLDLFREIGEKYGAEAQARATELLRLAFQENNK